MQLPSKVLYLTGSLKVDHTSGVVHVKYYNKLDNKLVLLGESDSDMDSPDFKVLVNKFRGDSNDTIYISVSKNPSKAVPAAVYKSGNSYFVGYKNKRSARLSLYDMISLLVGLGCNIPSDKLDDLLISMTSWTNIELDQMKVNKRSAYWPTHSLDTSIGESMNTLPELKLNPVIKRLFLEENLLTHLGESVDNIEKYFDQDMIDYMNQNLNDPARRDGFLKAVKRYQAIAKNTTDPLQSLYYEYRAYLPEQQAMNLARDFYRKQYRSGTGSDVGIGAEGEEYSIVDSIGYGNSHANKGMFASLSRMDKTPNKATEVEDLLTKLFDSKLLDSSDKIVLITYMILGTGPGLRAKTGGDKDGIDLEALMDKPPKELKVVTDQIKKLIKFGIDPDAITSEKILQGANKNDGEDSAIRINPLVGTNRVQVAKKNISKALTQLVGTDDISKIKQLLLGGTINPMGAYEAKQDNEIAIRTILEYLDGKSVTTGNLIKAIVYAVDANIKTRTRMSKSKLFSGSVKEVSKAYLKLAKSGKSENIMLVQNMMMAPVLDSADPRR